MPGRNDATEMQQKKSRVENMLKQDTRMVQDVTKLDQRLNREYYSIESTRSDVQFIDEVLNLPASVRMEFADKDLYRLQAIQGRNLSHLLINDQKTGGDSPEMESVKKHVTELEEIVAQMSWDSSELEPVYQRAIAACQFYCDNKNPSFETGIERKKRVQATLDRLKEESRQISVAREVLKDKKMREERDKIRSVQDLMVFGQEYLSKYDDPLAQMSTKEVTGVRALTFEDFAAMIGTHNRGQVEFKNGKLRVINNSWFKQTGLYEGVSQLTSNTEKTVANRQMRERLYDLVKEKLGDSDPEYLEDLKDVLQISDGARKAEAISRKELVRIFSTSALVCSDVARILRKGRTSEDKENDVEELTERHAKHRLAMVARDVLDIGGTANDRVLIESTDEQKEQLRAKVTEILKKGKELGVKTPSLSTHQMNNLVNGGLVLVRDRIFSALNQVYHYALHLSNSKGADFNKLAAQTKMIDKIAALVLTQYATTSETRKELAESQLQEYIKEAAFSFMGEAKDTQKKDGSIPLEKTFDRMYVGNLGEGAEGIEYAIARRLPDCKAWKNHKYAVRTGAKRLKNLCEKMNSFGELRARSLEEGLSEQEAGRMIWLGERIDAELTNQIANQTSVNELELVAKELKGTRFAEGYAQAKKLIDQQFSFAEAARALSRAVTCEKVEKKKAQAQSVAPDLDEQLQLLDKEARSVADVMLLTKNPAALIKEREDQNAKSLIRLRDVLRTFPQNQVYMRDVRIGDTSARMIQKADNSLHLVVNGQAIPLTRDAQQFANLIENDIMENGRMYGLAHAKELMNGLDVSGENQGAKLRARGLLSKLLAAETSKPETFFTNISVERLKEFAQDLLEGHRSAEQIINYVNEVDSKNYINGQETRELLDKKALAEELEDQVVIRQPVKEKEKDPAPEWSEEQKQVQSLITELIYSQDTWKIDDTIEQPGVRMRNVLQDHVNTLVMLLNKPQLIDEMLKALPFPEVSEEEKGTQSDIRAQIGQKMKAFLEVEEIQKLKKLSDGKTGFMKSIAEKAQWSAIHLALASPASLEALEELDKSINDAVSESVGKIQEQIRTMVDQLFSGKSEHADPLAAQEFKDPRQAGITALERKARMEVSKAKLKSIIDDAAKGSEGQGLFLKNVLKNYFSNDYEKVPLIDQRAMLASALRNVKPVPVLGQNATEEEKSRVQKTAMGNFFGGFLKGAGPLLQKILQGMPENSMPEELRGALKDMKSNLAPIPERIVRAQLQNMIDRSNKKITNIEVTRALGAASVGQTFLCKMYGPGLPKDGTDVVVKLLRPNVRNRMLREKKVMTFCTKLTDHTYDLERRQPTGVKGGMEATYEGQLARIEEELDLTLEAKNVQKGSVYNEGYKDVSTMKVNNLVEPTTNALVLERAPGTTVDKYLEETGKKQKQLVSQFYVLDQKGNPQMDEDGKMPRLLITDGNVNALVQTRKELTEMLAQIQKRQKYLLQLTEMWVREGVYGSGFYHGDLHAGNIMVDDHGLTVIDFGNATKLTNEQQEYVTRMMMAASVGDVEIFRNGFHKLLENTPEEKYQEKREQLTQVFREVFRLGDKKSAGERIAAALMKAQTIGIELPSAIYNFSQCQIRLQNTVNDMNDQIRSLQEDIQRIDRMGTAERKEKDAFKHYLNDVRKTAVSDLEEKRKAKELPEEASIAELYGNIRRQISDISGEQIHEQLRQKTKSDRDNFENNYYAKQKKTVKAVRDLEEFVLGLKETTTPEIYQGVVSGIKVSLHTYLEPIFRALFYTERDKFQEVQKELDACVTNIHEEGMIERLKEVMNVIRGMENYQAADRELLKLKRVREAQDDPSTDKLELERLEMEICSDHVKRHHDIILDRPEFSDFRDNLMSEKEDFRAEMDQSMQFWFADTENLGVEMKAAYEAFRTAQAAQAEDLEQKLDAFMDLYHKAVLSRVTQMEELFRSGEVQLGAPGDFLDAMGNVLEDNLKSSLWRLGLFTAKCFRKKMEKEEEEAKQWEAQAEQEQKEREHQEKQQQSQKKEEHPISKEELEAYRQVLLNSGMSKEAVENELKKIRVKES